MNAKKNINEQFQKEFKELLIKFNAELTIGDFSRDLSSLCDEKIVVKFNDRLAPDWVIGRWENGID
jgi:hypothetical protein